MKKVLIIILSFISFYGYSQLADIDSIDNRESGSSARAKLNDLITDHNDSTATPQMVSDSTQHAIDSAKNYTDTQISEIDNYNRDSTRQYVIDSALVNRTELGDTASAIRGDFPTTIDSLQSYKNHKDTIYHTCFSNPYDTFNLTGSRTWFLDTVNAYGYSAFTNIDVYGTNDWTSSLSITTNADGLNIKYNVDSLWNDSTKINVCYISYNKSSQGRKFYVIFDTVPAIYQDVTAPLANSATVESSNPDSLIVVTSENVQGTEGAGTGGFTITGYGSLTITNINISNDTIGLALSDSVTADSTYTYSYNSATGDIEDMSGNDLASFSDSSITNNVSSIPTDSLIAYYPFNNNANDESENTHNGSVSGATITTDRHGNANSAYSFDGSNDQITINDHDDFTLDTTLSISCWIKPTGTITSHVIISKYNTVTTEREWYLAISSGKIGLLLFDEGELAYIRRYYDTDIITDSLYHVVVTSDGTDQITGMNVYLQGNELDDASDVSANTYIEMDNGVQDVLIGRRVHASTQQWFNGVIDDIRIYNKELTQEEVTAIFNGEKPSSW